jgi:hypothetical protein
MIIIQIIIQGLSWILLIFGEFQQQIISADIGALRLLSVLERMLWFGA